MDRYLQGIRDQLDEHRQSINENTCEIQANHAYLGQMSEKLDVLGRQLAVIAEVLKKAGLVAPERVEAEPEIEPLTPKEKEAFQALYILSESQTCVTYKDIARKLGNSENLVSGYVTAMIEKGIPISKNYNAAGTALLHLNEGFRQRQARENIVGINPILTYWVR